MIRTEYEEDDIIKVAFNRQNVFSNDDLIDEILLIVGEDYADCQSNF